MFKGVTPRAKRKQKKRNRKVRKKGKEFPYYFALRSRTQSHKNVGVTYRKIREKGGEKRKRRQERVTQGKESGNCYTKKRAVDERRTTGSNAIEWGTPA